MWCFSLCPDYARIMPGLYPDYARIMVTDYGHGIWDCNQETLENKVLAAKRHLDKKSNKFASLQNDLRTKDTIYSIPKDHTRYSALCLDKEQN